MNPNTQPSRRSPRRHLPAAMELHDPVWRRWAVIALLLAADLGGLAGAHELALALATYQAVTGLSGPPTPRHFRSQVRLTYLAVMAISFLPGLAVLAWVQMLGTFALVLVGYCPLARVMLLLPLNRSGRLSWGLVRRVLLSPPTTGPVTEALLPRT